MWETRARIDADCETVASWIDDAEGLYLFTGPRLTWPIEPSHLQVMAQIPGLTAWVVVDNRDSTDSAIAGHFDLTLKDGTARLARVIIDPALRGRGLSHMLVVLAEERARELGATQLSLNVIDGNLPAITTYERAGFRRTESERPGISSMMLTL
ncbi:GNAT family N-acetyltransferase [Microbacterium sp. W4I4]|uniref:GNAT family N-acetyltransferase n=1 Tax=Microbacterium sp. W4I4 TaxID=3042295 RepID=UPI0027D7763E|nr:GNAT family N-acetyltransferase [Microbacterium sp. W4I4]